MLLKDHQYASSILEYDPESGNLYWVYNPNKSNIWNSKYASMRAGSIMVAEHGMCYWRIKHNFKNYLAHRIAWFLMTKTVPEFLDHKDEDGLNNKWNNLRESTRSQNRANMWNKVKGIDQFPNGKWRAKITVDQVQHHLGMFDTKEQAFEVYKEASQEVFGDFSVYNRR